MLPKKIRLTTAIFDQVFKLGKVFHGQNFWLRVLPYPGGLSSRFAVVVSKKVVPTAVGRNRIRRMVYSAVERTGKAQFVIVGVKKDISSLKVADIGAEIRELILKSYEK